MRIGIDLRLHAYAPGGISRYARRLARAIAECVTADQLVLISHRREEVPLEIPGVRTRRVITPPHHALERWLLGLELRTLGLDVLHSTDFIPPAWGARRRVITIHDLNFLYYPDYLTAEARRYYNRQIEWAVARADAIVVDSYATQRDLVQLLEVRTGSITVAHLAADERFAVLPEAEVAQILSAYDLTPGYLLFVGVWEPRKNLPGLFEALAILRDTGQRLTLAVVGRPGWLYAEVNASLQRLRLERWVRFIERPPVGDLVALYNGAQCLIIPSFYEGFGLPALEAMQCGTPVIVSDRASLPEVVGEAGLLIDPDDPVTIASACRQMVEDAGLRRTLRAAGLARAQAFSWRQTAERTLQAYRAALAA